MKLAEASKRASYGTVTALLLSDNQFSLELMATTLTGVGVRQKYRCDRADGAMQILHGLNVDLVLVDCDGARMDGPDFVRAVRADTKCRNRYAPVILFASQVNAIELARGRDSGASTILAKPYSSAILSKWLDWLGRDTRPFVSSPSYSGPCRRMRQIDLPEGFVGRRQTDLRHSKMGVGAVN